jgi:hypothetical protein
MQLFPRSKDRGIFLRPWAPSERASHLWTFNPGSYCFRGFFFPTQLNPGSTDGASHRMPVQASHPSPAAALALTEISLCTKQESSAQAQHKSSALT